MLEIGFRFGVEGFRGRSWPPDPWARGKMVDPEPEGSGAFREASAGKIYPPSLNTKVTSRIRFCGLFGPPRVWGVQGVLGLQGV